MLSTQYTVAFKRKIGKTQSTLQLIIDYYLCSVLRLWAGEPFQPVMMPDRVERSPRFKFLDFSLFQCLVIWLHYSGLHTRWEFSMTLGMYPSSSPWVPLWMTAKQASCAHTGLLLFSQQLAYLKYRLPQDLEDFLFKISPYNCDFLSLKLSVELITSEEAKKYLDVIVLHFS